jgi:hypothetical protein
VDKGGNSEGRVQAARQTIDPPAFSASEDGAGAAWALSTYHATLRSLTPRAGSKGGDQADSVGSSIPGPLTDLEDLVSLLEGECCGADVIAV